MPIYLTLASRVWDCQKKDLRGWAQGKPMTTIYYRYRFRESVVPANHGLTIYLREIVELLGEDVDTLPQFIRLDAYPAEAGETGAFAKYLELATETDNSQKNIREWAQRKPMTTIYYRLGSGRGSYPSEYGIRFYLREMAELLGEEVDTLPQFIRLDAYPAGRDEVHPAEAGEE